jgi:hypothetical protein
MANSAGQTGPAKKPRSAKRPTMKKSAKAAKPNGRARKAAANGTRRFATRGTDFRLEQVIAPIGPAAFFRTYWEKKPLVINRRKRDYYGELLTLEDIDQVITSMNLPYPEIELVNAKEQVSRSQYTRGNNKIDVAKLYDLFAAGATVILPHLHTRLPSLAAFCRGMELDFSMPYQTNIYLTPENAQGFKTHYDTHDVFVLQIAGTKSWRIYDNPVTLPHRGQRFNASETKAGDVSQTFTLRPGDMVYIPRGILHDADAQAQKGTSLHITVGALAYTWTDLMLEAMSAVSIRDEDFRRSLPVGYAKPGYRKAKAKDEFHRLIRKFAKTADFDDALGQFADRITAAHQPVLVGQMEQVAGLAQLTTRSVIEPRPALIYSLTRDSGQAVVSISGKEIAFPGFAGTAVRYALATKRYRIGDLPGDLDDDGKVTLVSRLIREGLLMAVGR